MRWRVRGLHCNPALAARLTAALAGTIGVIEVTSNAQTGKTLVVFGEWATTAEQLETLMLQELGADGVETANPVPSRSMLGDDGQEIQFAIALGGAAALTSLSRVFFLSRTLNALSLGRPSLLGVVRRAGPPTVLMVLSAVLYSRLRRSNKLVRNRVGRRRQIEWRMEVARRVAQAELAALDRTSSSDLSNRVRSSLAEIERGFEGVGSSSTWRGHPRPVCRLRSGRTAFELDSADRDGGNGG